MSHSTGATSSVKTRPPARRGAMRPAVSCASGCSCTGSIGALASSRCADALASVASNIGGPDTQSYVYMHMRGPSPLRKGQRVLTGQPVGEVGDTGRASGCHLHFEMWTAPGWYQGGTAVDPLPELTRWDAFS